MNEMSAPDGDLQRKKIIPVHKVTSTKSTPAQYLLGLRVNLVGLRVECYNCHAWDAPMYALWCPKVPGLKSGYILARRPGPAVLHNFCNHFTS